MKRKSLRLRGDAQYLKAFALIMSRIERAIASSAREEPVVACIAGGAAMHFYTGARFSDDVDATFTRRVLLDPGELQVAYRGQDGHARLLYLDTQYNDTFALMHEGACADAIPMKLPRVDPRRLEVRLLTPLDLAVSKLARFTDQDREDIRLLAREGLVDADALRRRAEDALAGYVGNMERVRNSIRIACDLVARERD